MSAGESFDTSYHAHPHLSPMELPHHTFGSPYLEISPLVGTCRVAGDHRMTLFALSITLSGTVRRRSVAAFRFRTNSNLIGRSTGKSPGFAPPRSIAASAAR